jgi:hypothetical protein
MITRLEPQDFELYSGNHKTLHFTYLDENDIAVNLAGATIVWALANHEKSKSRLITYTSPTNVTIIDAANGKFDVSIQGADTEGFKAGDYYHEARVTSSGSSVTTVAVGTVELKHNVIDT